MSIFAIAFTDKGMELGERLKAAAQQELELTRCDEGGVMEWTSQHFLSGNSLIFIGAAGIAVRAISPFLRRKSVDPAVVVMDELGKFAIPILSGHIGGANALAVALADFTGGTPVITTATDTENVFAVDTWASSIGLRIANPEKIKYISSKLLAGGTVRFSSIFPIGGAAPEGLVQVDDMREGDFVISYLSGTPEDALHLVPPVLTLGVGCKKGTSCAELEAAFQAFMRSCGCHELAVRELCSIDLKANEPGLREFCKIHELPARFFSVDELRDVPGEFSVSHFVAEITGIDNVCERSAVLGSDGTLLVRKTIYDGITMALAIKEPANAEESSEDE